MKKMFLSLLIVLGLLGGTAAPGWSGAEVSLRARPGLAGVYKVNHPVPISVEIENRGGDIRGELVVVPRQKDSEPVPHNIQRSPEYRSLVNITGGKSSVFMVVPGEIAAGAGTVSLISGGTVLAETALEGAAVAGGIVVLPLSEKVSGSSLFKWLDKTNGGQVTVKYLPAGELPGKSLFLQGADILVADREAASLLDPSQLTAIREWVLMGGTLLLSGREGTVAGGPFRDMDPGQGEAFARRVLGRGQVILSSMPIEEIHDPEGTIWGSMGIAPSAGERLHEKEAQLKNMESGMINQMGNYFPMLRVPDISVLILLWVIYSLAVGPGIYLGLRRYNRRDLSWVIIPALALAAGLGLYAIPPVNRLNAYLGQAMSTVEIVHPELAEVRTSGNFVLPRGGSLEVRGSADGLLQPANYGHRGRPVLVYSGNESRVVFSSVEYGSMRQVNAFGALAGAGAIDGRVYFRDDRVMGEITNNTSFNLRDCRLLVGPALLELGDMPAGTGQKIDQYMNRSLLLTNPGDIYKANLNSPSRESRIVAQTTASREPSGEIYFLGWSDSPAGELKVLTPTGQGQTSGLTLVRQRMEADFPAGPFKLPPGLLKSQVTGIDGGYGWRPEGLMVHRGSVKVSYDIKKTLNRDSFRITGIEVPQLPDRTNYTLEIFRQDVREWEPLEAGGQKLTGSDVTRYISGQGIIEVKLTSRVEKDVQGAFRGISVEGVIGQ